MRTGQKINKEHNKWHSQTMHFNSKSFRSKPMDDHFVAAAAASAASFFICQCSSNAPVIRSPQLPLQDKYQQCMLCVVLQWCDRISFVEWNSSEPNLAANSTGLDAAIRNTPSWTVTAESSLNWKALSYDFFYWCSLLCLGPANNS